MDDSTRGVYERRGLGARQGAGRRPALVVVDFSAGFTDPASPLHCDCDDALAVTAELLAAARESGAPVLYTTVAYDEAGRKAASAFIAKAPPLATLAVGSRWVEIDERIAPRPDEPVLTKLFASGFFGTPLAAMLTAAGCDTVVVVGASTSGCVRATAVDALQHGFRVVVPRDAVADRAPGAHQASLTDIDGKYGDVVSGVEALAILGRQPAEQAAPA
jgi:nicotinamidase-related amidase